MSRLLPLLLLGLAIICVGIIFNAGGSLALQEGAATAAVTLIVIAGVLLYWASRSPAVDDASLPDRSALAPATGPSAIEQAFAEGPFGRERIAVTLDAIERATRNPTLPAATPDELDRFWRMRPAEFRTYVSERLDVLERET